MAINHVRVWLSSPDLPFGPSNMVTNESQRALVLFQVDPAHRVRIILKVNGHCISSLSPETYNLYRLEAFCSQNKLWNVSNLYTFYVSWPTDEARMYLQLPLWQWGAGNVYLLVSSSLKVNIDENPIAVMGL